jgi:hypothetical protein
MRIMAAKRTPMLTFDPFSLETEILAFTFSTIPNLSITAVRLNGLKIKFSLALHQTP